MKHIKLTVFLITGLCACSTSPNASEIKVKDSSVSITLSSEEKKDLKGVWWPADDKEAPCASFEINDSTIYYPDQEEKSDFKYAIKEDSLIVYFEGFTSASKIEKVNKDTLELITNGEKQTFIKAEK